MEDSNFYVRCVNCTTAVIVNIYFRNEFVAEQLTVFRGIPVENPWFK